MIIEIVVAVVVDAMCTKALKVARNIYRYLVTRN